MARAAAGPKRLQFKANHVAVPAEYHRQTIVARRYLEHGVAAQLDIDDGAAG
jgi:hypothetical protein